MFVLYAVGAGVALGYALGGALEPLGRFRLHWWWGALAGLAIQLVLFAPVGAAVPRTLAPAAYICSIVLVLIVIVRNLQTRGFPIIAVGAGLNLLAVVANGGYMPTTLEALRFAGRGAADGYSNSVLSASPSLYPLVDCFALPAWIPLANVFSIGDVFIASGIAVAIAWAMRRGSAADVTDAANGVGGLPRGFRSGPAGARRLPHPSIGIESRLRSRRLQIGVFAAALLALGTAGLVWFVLPMPTIASPIQIPWPLLAIGFYLAETQVIEVSFRRETHSLTLSEVPTVLGLFFVDPRSYLLAVMVGAGVGLLRARQPPLKLAFNIGQYLVGAVTALVVFRTIAPQVAASGPREWIAAFVATAAVAVFSATSIATAITLSGAAPQFQRFPRMIQVGVGIAIANTSVALLAVDELWLDPGKLWLLAVPIVALFYSYRAFITERRKHESMELLYESSRVFQHSPELDSAMKALLEHTRNMFRSDRAELLIFPIGSMPYCTSVGPGDASESMTPAPAAIEVARRLSADPTAYLFKPLPGSIGGDRLYPNAMISPLRGESGVIGALTVSNRIGEDEAFAADELRLLETVANQAAMALENTQLEQSLAELSRLKEELRELAFNDPLTGLANRTLFHERVNDVVSRVGDAQEVTVLFLDLDDFKIVNDTLGHAAGDDLLRAFASRLRERVRTGDIPARLGGDEFAVLLAGNASVAVATSVADRIIEGFNQPFLVGGREFVVTASVGIATARAGTVATDELLRNADVAMYAAKSRGKSSVSLYDAKMHSVAIERHELRGDLSAAVRRRDLEVQYQPIVDIDCGKVIGVEALARWTHPTRGRVPPEMFISLAEESGAIVELGAQILQLATQQIAEWSASGRRSLTVTVNVSPAQVRRSDFVDVVLDALRQSELSPRSLVLEMTETMMFRESAEIMEALQRLRTFGIRLAIDDFGTGYSSLGYLHQFPVDVLKIAREFVSGEHDNAEMPLAEAMIALGRALRFQVVAEGIETAVHHERLRALGCGCGQGFYYSSPVDLWRLHGTIDEIERRLVEQVAPGGPFDEVGLRQEKRAS